MGFYNETTEIQGLGATPNMGNKRSIVTGLIMLPREQQYAATIASAGLEATLEELVIAKTAFPLFNIMEVESTTSEDIVYTAGTGEMVDISRGVKGLKLKFFGDNDQMKTLYSWEGKNWDAAIFDKNNNIYLRQDGATLKGFTVSRFKVGTVTEATKDTPAMAIVDIQFDDQNQFREYESSVKASFPLKSYTGVLRCVLTPTVVGGDNVFNVAVNYVSTTTASGTAYESIPITGLLIANFLVLNGSDVEVTPTSITETSVKGTYTVTCTTFVNGSIQLKPTSGQLYESIKTTVAAS